jgi:NAD(P)-dependent dehydrogenase (short-subunit alcohol dehydrogenase family)
VSTLDPAALAALHSLAGRRVLVIADDGAGDAISLARIASTRGARVVLTVEDGPADPPNGVVLVRAPSDTEAGIDALFDAAGDALAVVDTIIAFIGSPPLDAPHETSLIGWQETVVTPLRRAFWLARRSIEEFLTGDVPARLLLVASGNDVVASALEAIARSFSREYGRRGHACNVIVVPSSGGGGGPALTAHALFLASPAASFVTGEVMRVQPAPTSSDEGRSA